MSIVLGLSLDYPYPDYIPAVFYSRVITGFMTLSA
jgi:hypothetical protein